MAHYGNDYPLETDCTRRYLRAARGSLTLWWLGQAGFVIKSPGGKLVVIDPYLSNSAKAIGEQHGLNLDRLVPPPCAPSDWWESICTR